MANFWQILTTLGVGENTKETRELKELQAKQNELSKQKLEETKRHNQEMLDLQKEQVKLASMTDKQKLEYQKQKAKEKELEKKAEDIFGNFDPHDPAVLKAVNISLRNGKFSTSLLETYLSETREFVGALAIWFEELGIIGPINGKKPREVLINSMEEYEKKIQDYVEKELSEK